MISEVCQWHMKNIYYGNSSILQLQSLILPLVTTVQFCDFQSIFANISSKKRGYTSPDKTKQQMMALINSYSFVVQRSFTSPPSHPNSEICSIQKLVFHTSRGCWIFTLFRTQLFWSKLLNFQQYIQHPKAMKAGSKKINIEHFACF